MTKAQGMAKELCDEWIAEERKLRIRLATLATYAASFAHVSGKATALAKCRRELQEKFKLVLVP